MAEIVGAGWISIAPEQTQAARAFGYTGFRLLRRIFLP
jgi:ABC-type amino acid transport system permease subunit